LTAVILFGSGFAGWTAGISEVPHGPLYRMVHRVLTLIMAILGYEVASMLLAPTVSRIPELARPWRLAARGGILVIFLAAMVAAMMLGQVGMRLMAGRL
jgi:hypothetical protein